MKFSVKDFFSKCDQIRKKLQIWSHLLKKSLMENSFHSVAKGTCLAKSVETWEMSSKQFQRINPFLANIPT